MKVIAAAGNEEIAKVYIVDLGNGQLVECVESLQPPLARHEKWVLLVSTMFGCPVGCKMCDAGGFYHGKPSAAQILDQIDFLVRQRFPDGHVPSRQFKIQFSRMGEPSLNPAVLDVLEALPQHYQAPGLMPSLSTVAPASTGLFFDRLLEIKRRLYSGGHFQFQFSLHTTDLARRDQLIPVKKWSFAEMAAYGQHFYAPGDRKITLNFALADDMPLDPAVLLQYFDPELFLVKITPLNPTYRAAQHRLVSYLDPNQAGENPDSFSSQNPLIRQLAEAGYQVIVSIGESEENLIGSNCGQYLRTHLSASQPIQDGYTYQVQECGVAE